MEVFNREKFCEECKFDRSWGKGAKTDYSRITLARLRSLYSVTSYHAKLRGHARSVFLRNRGKLVCAECGYARHVDIAHVKEVKAFDSDTAVAVVNAFDNLRALCPTHHAKFDGKTRRATKYYRLSDPGLSLAELEAAHGSKWLSKVREDASARYAEAELPLACMECGDDRYVEIAHVRAIKDFPRKATVEEVNRLSNLKALCPNHHWELDHPSVRPIP